MAKPNKYGSPYAHSQTAAEAKSVRERRRAGGGSDHRYDTMSAYWDAAVGATWDVAVSNAMKAVLREQINGWKADLLTTDELMVESLQNWGWATGRGTPKPIPEQTLDQAVDAELFAESPNYGSW